jgi:mono/diheme cytochrome c family protein
MKKISTTLTAFIALAAVAACKNEKTPEPKETPPAAAITTTTRAAVSPVERGRYIVTTSGCHDCHTPWAMGPNGPAPDMTRALSGHPQSLEMPPPPKLPPGPWLVTAAATNTAWSGPWGVSFTANLTPDRDTGLGTWTKQNFVDTIRNGRHLGIGRPILPPMPAPVYANMTDEDLGAVFDYLQTLPAISNKVPAPLPPPAPRPPAKG